MKAKLLFNDKEFEVEISEEQVQALTKTKKKTGYERMQKDKDERYYYVVISSSCISEQLEEADEYNDACYNSGNYYSDKTVAENNARADKLYRQLRRFAVEHRDKRLDWKDNNQEKYMILYNHSYNKIETDYYFRIRNYANIYFDSRETAQLAVDTFKDELLWYFTEYKDSL